MLSDKMQEKNRIIFERFTTKIFYILSSPFQVASLYFPSSYLSTLTSFRDMYREDYTVNIHICYVTLCDLFLRNQS